MDKPRRYKKYFVLSGSDVKVVNAAYFKSLKSRMHALSMGVDIFLELHRQLCEDAIENGDLYIKSIKITDGFSRSLEALDQNFPGIMQEIRSCPRRGRSVVVSKC